MAAAIGAGLPVHEATGNMVVDVGGGTTEVAVISLGGIVTCLSIRTAGDDLDQAIIALDEEGVLPDARGAHRRGDQDDPRLGLPAARRAARPRSAAATWSPGCRAPSSVSSAEVRQALEEPLHAIVDAVRATLDQTPPELAGDIMDRGIVLTGGGALLRGLDERLRHETGMPVHVAENPLHLGGAGRRQVRRGVRGAPAGARRRAAAIGWTGVSADGPAPTGRAAPVPRSLLVPLVLACAHADHPRPARRRRLARRAGAPRRRRGRSARSRPAPRPRVRPFTAVPAWFRTRGSLRARRRPARGRELPAARRRSPPRTRPQPARRVRRPHRRRPGAPATRWCPARVVAMGPAQSFSPHRDHRRRHRAPGCSPDHDRGQQRRAGRPGPPGHPHHRHRAAGRRRRLGRRRPGRREHGGRLPAAAAACSATTAASTSSSSTTRSCPAEGDVVVTWGSEDGAPYVSGVPVGRVDRGLQQPARQSAQRAVIEPYVDFSALDLVGVVVPVRHRERPGRDRGRREPPVTGACAARSVAARRPSALALVLQVVGVPAPGLVTGVVPNLVPAGRGRRRADPRARVRRGARLRRRPGARPRPAGRPRRRPLGAGPGRRRVRRRPGPPGRRRPTADRGGRTVAARSFVGTSVFALSGMLLRRPGRRRPRACCR